MQKGAITQTKKEVRIPRLLSISHTRVAESALHGKLKAALQCIQPVPPNCIPGAFPYGPALAVAVAHSTFLKQECVKAPPLEGFGR